VLVTVKKMVMAPFCKLRRARNFVAFRITATLIIILLSCGCYSIPQSINYKAPPERPAEIDAYYPIEDSYRNFTSSVLKKKDDYTINRYTIINRFTPITVDYYQRHEKNDRLILVFPVLGGRNIIADYFARYFAMHGYDTAVVHRNNAFKSPENFDRIEEIMREDVIRDRIVLDFFEKEIGKRDFGSFGISRGGINVAMTAGVDARLKHNVITLGGTDIVELFRQSSQGRIARYVNTVVEQKGIDRTEFFRLLSERVKTDPKRLAQYMDSKNTLMILGLFDTTVPFKFGQELRAQIGNPKTIYLLADHYVGLLYTQFLHYVVPSLEHTILPLDYVETEALDFFDRSFKTKPRGSKPALLSIVQAPFAAVGRVLHYLFVSDY
jgi:hypothetical protein